MLIWSRTDDLAQAHIPNKAFDLVVAIIDIYNTPTLSEKIFKIILDLSGNGSLLLLGYKRYFQLNEKQKRVMNAKDREVELDFRNVLGTLDIFSCNSILIDHREVLPAANEPPELLHCFANLGDCRHGDCEDALQLRVALLGHFFNILFTVQLAKTVAHVVNFGPCSPQETPRH